MFVSPLFCHCPSAVTGDDTPIWEKRKHRYTSYSAIIDKMSSFC